jgi:hypothetical protein
VEVYDVKHKAACLLKQRLENNADWKQFQSRMAQARSQMQQTELAFLASPLPKPKARFMNLEPTLRWAEHALAIVQHPPPGVQQRVRPERLQDKLGWLAAYAARIAEWSEWQRVVNVTVRWVNEHGVYRGSAKALWNQLRVHSVHPSSRELAKELLAFVVRQAKDARREERFPGSTEVLESCFGRFKQLEKQQARGGFTSLVLGFGALLAETTTRVIREAMQQSHTKEILAWCKEQLGTTVFAQRKLALATRATEHG